MAELARHRARLLRWGVIGVVVSVTVIVLISGLAQVSISEVAKIGAFPFVLASAASLSRLPIQAVRFRMLARAMSGKSDLDLRQASGVRVGSEFVALTTPALVGGELVRAAWLAGRQVETGRALWIGYFEVLLDVYVGSALSLLAAAFAASRGAIPIAGAITAVILPIVLGYTLVFLLPAVRGSKVPSWPFRIAGGVIGQKRAEVMKDSVESAVLSFASATRELVRKGAVGLIGKLLLLTVLVAFVSGVSLWAIFGAVGQQLDILTSVLVAYGSFALAALPITVGGSGITEIAVQWYMSTVLGFGSWSAVIAWRIASYHVTLAVSGIAFFRLLARVIRREGTSHIISRTEVE